MRFFPKTAVPKRTRLVTDTFLGYHHSLKTADGEFYDMSNLTSADFPLLSPRKKRGRVKGIARPRAIEGKDQLAVIDGGAFYYGDYESELQLDGREPKTMVSMGAYILIFPDKKYFNTADMTCGELEAHFEAELTEDAPLRLTLCTADGTAYAEPSLTEPESPENGDLWIDTSGDTAALMQYSSALAMWSQIPTVYTRIYCKTLGLFFEVGDGVAVEGIEYTGDLETMKQETAALCGSKVIYARDTDSIVVTGLISQAYTQSSGTLKVSRNVPDMDFVIECQNRLWGCRYSFSGGTAVNEIYCCKLGDFKNWSCFAGIATDSWVGAVGSDGAFTGAVNYLGCPTFFKENVIHRVNISSVGAHRISETVCRGVQKGSERSICAVNEILYYKSPTDVCAYDGTLPVSVSDALGDTQYYDAAAGVCRSKYYISMRDGGDVWHMLVYDTARGIWHHEDNAHAEEFASCGGELYFIQEHPGELGTASGSIMTVGGSVGELEESVKWRAETGLQYYEYPDKKYVSRFNFRMKMEAGASVLVSVMYDSSGEWIYSGGFSAAKTGTFTLPVTPRRCDHMKLSISGTGDVKLFSVARVLETGSDV